MSHWYRLPNPISVGKLFSQSKQAFFADRGITAEAMKHLPANACFLPKGSSDGNESRESFILLCQEKHAILVTADQEYARALTDEPNRAWGVILLPSDAQSQVRILLRLSAGNLTFRPTKESTDIIEFARRNRMLLDARRDPPLLSLYAKCKWTA